MGETAVLTATLILNTYLIKVRIVGTTYKPKETPDEPRVRRYLLPRDNQHPGGSELPV